MAAFTPMMPSSPRPFSPSASTRSSGSGTSSASTSGASAAGGDEVLGQIRIAVGGAVHHRLLEQRRAEPPDHPARELALRGQRVEDPPRREGAGEPGDPDLPGLGVDVDLRELRPEAPGHRLPRAAQAEPDMAAAQALERRLPGRCPPARRPRRSRRPLNRRPLASGIPVPSGATSRPPTRRRVPGSRPARRPPCPVAACARTCRICPQPSASALMRLVVVLDSARDAGRRQVRVAEPDRDPLHRHAEPVRRAQGEQRGDAVADLVVRAGDLPRSRPGPAGPAWSRRRSSPAAPRRRSRAPPAGVRRASSPGAAPGATSRRPARPPRSRPSAAGSRTAFPETGSTAVSLIRRSAIGSMPSATAISSTALSRANRNGTSGGARIGPGVLRSTRTVRPAVRMFGQA